MTDVVTSTQFDTFVYDKYFERLSALALDLIDESTETDGFNRDEKAAATLDTVEGFQNLFLALPQPEHVTDLMAMRLVQNFLLDMTPLFHAYVIDAIDVALLQRHANDDS